MKFKTSGVCSRAIDFDVVDGKVVNVHFTGGCAGNTQGVAALSRAWTLTKLSKEWTVSNVAIKTHHVLTSLLKP